MKKIMWTYSLTILAGAIAIIIVAGTLLSVKSALWFVIIGAVFLVLMGLFTDYVINKYIKELAEMDKYKTLWDSLKNEKGYITDSWGDAASPIKGFMEDMEKEIETTESFYQN